MDSNQSEQLVEQTLRGLKGYVVVGKSYIRVWHAWLLIGIIAGLMAGVFYVANRSGQFQLGKASEPTVIKGVLGLTASVNPQASQLVVQALSEYNVGGEECKIVTYPWNTMRITNGLNSPIVRVPAGTPITRLGVPITLADLKSFEAISIEGEFNFAQPNIIIAKRINAVNALLITGKITTVSTPPTSLILSTLQLGKKNIAITGNTKVFTVAQGVNPGTTGDLQPNRMALVGIVNSGGADTAAWIAVQTGAIQLSGSLPYGVAGSILSINVQKQQVTVNPYTAFINTASEGQPSQPCIVLSPFSINLYNTLISLFGSVALNSGTLPPGPIPSLLPYTFTVPVGVTITRVGIPIAFSDLKQGDLINARVIATINNIPQKTITINVTAKSIEVFNTSIAVGNIKLVNQQGVFTVQTILKGTMNFVTVGNTKILTFSTSQGLQSGTVQDIVANKYVIVGYIGGEKNTPPGSVAWIIVQK